MISIFRRLAYLGSLLRPRARSAILGSFRVVVFGASIAFWAFSAAAILVVADTVDAQEVLNLTPNLPITREIKGGEIQTYKIFVDSGLFVHVTADQQGVDIVLTLLGPNHEKIADYDSNSGEWGWNPFLG